METPTTLEQLTDEIRDLALQVNSALERSEERDLVAATHLAVEKASQHYREYFGKLSEGDKMKVERTVGRRLADAKRLASTLPRIGSVTGASTPDRRVTGASEVGERRITGVSWGAGNRSAGLSSGLKVGGEIEAWCSPCGSVTDHNIVAIVGDEPKQVVCQACNARHNYRTTPARKATAEIEQPIQTSSYNAPADRERVRRGEEKEAQQRALANEIAQATDVRSFDPKARYRSGEIIVHPEFGRGKIETVLRSSLLVRFGVGGLKSVMLT